MSGPSQQTVLEEMLSAAIEAARKAREKADVDPFERGLLMAYYDMISLAKYQAEGMGVPFTDKTIAAFDPDKELLNYHKRAA